MLKVIKCCKGLLTVSRPPTLHILLVLHLCLATILLGQLHGLLQPPDTLVVHSSKKSSPGQRQWRVHALR